MIFYQISPRVIMAFMDKSKIIFSILAILFGAFLVVYGGYDDSPGAQLLGLVVVVAGIIWIIKKKKN
jgi:hypothetical protein